MATWPAVVPLSPGSEQMRLVKFQPAGGADSVTVLAPGAMFVKVCEPDPPDV